MLVFLGFALGTNKIGESFTNSNNTLGTLVSLGFASGTNDTLGIITTLYYSRTTSLTNYEILQGGKGEMSVGPNKILKYSRFEICF